jgi:hypothetical protein
MIVADQLSMFAAAPELEETDDERERRSYDLVGRAFECECRAAESRTEQGQARLLSKAKAYLAEAKELAPRAPRVDH